MQNTGIKRAPKHILFLLKISVLLIIISAGFLKSENPLCQRLSEHFILFARTTFAWFTSKDEVTNRLTASSDYGVSIVESFVPPKQWVPGQEINKDVYAVNTGNIDAFVKESISANMTYTYEKRVSEAPEAGADEGYVKLDETAIRAIDGATTMEAGGFIAWAAPVKTKPWQ